MSDAVFASRVDEINKEMATLMEQSIKRKDELRTESAHVSPTYATSSRYAPLISTSSDVVSREVQNCVHKEMKFFEDHVREIVNKEWESRAAEMDNLLRSRFVELKSANDSVGRVVLELTTEIANARKDMSSAVEDIKDKMEERFADLKREQTQRERQLTRELTGLKTNFDELSTAVSEDNAEFQTKVETMMRKTSERLNRVSSLYDEGMASSRAEIMEHVRAAQKKHSGEFDELERHLMQLHGSIEAADGIIKRTAGQMGAILEENGAHRSEIRALRSDTDRMEMMMQQKVDKGSGYIAGVVGTGGGASGGIGVEDALKIQQDVYALKQSVAYLGEMLDKVQSQRTGPLPGHHHHQQRAGSSSSNRAYRETRVRKTSGSGHPTGHHVGGGGYGMAEKPRRTTTRPSAFDQPQEEAFVGGYREDHRSASSNSHVDPQLQPQESSGVFGGDFVPENAGLIGGGGGGLHSNSRTDSGPQDSFIDSEHEKAGPRDWGSDTSEEQNSKLAQSPLDY